MATTQSLQYVMDAFERFAAHIVNNRQTIIQADTWKAVTE